MGLHVLKQSKICVFTHYICDIKHCIFRTQINKFLFELFFFLTYLQTGVCQLNSLIIPTSLDQNGVHIPLSAKVHIREKQ